MNYTIFGKNVSYILKKMYNNHHPSLQKELHLSNGMIGKYIKGQKPSLDTLIRLKEITGFSIDDLIYKDLSKESEDNL